jgi:hypothetical protein
VARIVLEPRWYEIGPFQEQYEALERELKGAGHDVRVDREVEQRSAGSTARTAYDLAVHVIDTVDEEIIEAIVLGLLARLRGKAILGGNRGGRRRVWLLGPRGEKLREVELPEDE